MKITLCVFLSITAGSVYGQVKQLHERVGQSVKFPTEVKNSGDVMYRGRVIANVNDGQRVPNSNNNRMHWESHTGFFSLSNLTMEDKGEYKVKNNGEKPVEVKYQLTVYDGDVPVSKPHITITYNEYPCKLNCTVERGTDATLTWHRGDEEKPYSISSVRSVPYLDLPQTVERSGTYTCEAKNSVSTERSDPLTVGDHCTGGAAGSWQTEGCRVWSLALGLVVMLHSLLV